MSVQIARHFFTVREYNRMGEAGILTEDDRVELIEGEIVEMSPIGKRHAACVDRLNRLINRQSGESVLVRVQSPIQLNDYSEPQPDVALLRFRDDFYERQHPMPEDVLLVIEVSETTAEYDRQIKIPLYARAGIKEVWTVNLTEERIEIYAQPEGGAYQLLSQARRGEEISAHNVSGLTLAIDSVLG